MYTIIIIISIDVWRVRWKNGKFYCALENPWPILSSAPAQEAKNIIIFVNEKHFEINWNPNYFLFSHIALHNLLNDISFLPFCVVGTLFYLLNNISYPNNPECIFLYLYFTMEFIFIFSISITFFISSWQMPASYHQPTTIKAWTNIFLQFTFLYFNILHISFFSAIPAALTCVKGNFAHLHTHSTKVSYQYKSHTWNLKDTKSNNKVIGLSNRKIKVN